ncbi:hypothetical protein D6C82_03433 [Aureobasidium pullulans]|nr:hypothetical protein D6C82_03433 [Aureobasidium pullulans]
MQDVLVDHGSDINARLETFQDDIVTPWSGTALRAASENGHLEVVHFLVDRGADIELIWSGTALRAASENGHLEVVQFLLDRGADVNSGYRTFPLHAALGRAHTEVCMLLLKRGADTRVRDDQYGTALHAAVRFGDLAIVKGFLKRGAHNTEWGLHGAVEAAVMTDRFDMLETLLLHIAERDRENDSLNTALWYTKPSTDGRIIRILLENGADNIHYKNSLLAKACLKGFVATVELLLDFDAKFGRHFDFWNETETRSNPLFPFLALCQGDQFEIVKLLVARDAKSNSSDLYNATALRYACAIGRYEIVKYLLEDCDDIPKTCDYLSLPLESACRNGSLEVIDMLLKYGAKVNEKNSDGQNAPWLSAGSVITKTSNLGRTSYNTGPNYTRITVEDGGYFI